MRSVASVEKAFMPDWHFGVLMDRVTDQNYFNVFFAVVQLTALEGMRCRHPSWEMLK